MRKLKTTILCIAACFLLLTLGSCNLPFFTPGETTDTPAVAVDVDPTAPANTDGAETILIPGGTFAMGSAETDLQAAADERPVHEVTIGTFYLYTHEVTNEMYTACVDAGACIPVNVMDSGPTTHIDDIAYANYPISGVDWNMARDYCAWAGARLPTEAEWEYAARGTESLLHPWGAEDPACDRTNMLGCLVPPDVVEVGSYLLGNSPFEVWDMAGNVWEWVHDWYADGYYTLSPATNPLGPYSYADPSNPLKVVRGGGLFSGPEQMRSADRAAANPYRAYDDVGFRCVAEGEAALNLPADYTETRDRHEMVPPDPLDGGGEPLDDPDDDSIDEIPHYYTGPSSATCPDAEGRITIYAEVGSSETGEYAMTVEGVPFDCSYSTSSALLTCTGPAPAATEYPDEYHVMIYFPGGLIGHQYPDIPTDCDTPFDPWGVWTETYCTIPEGDWVPDGDLLNVGIYTTIPIHWDTVTSSGEDLICWEVSDTETHCLVPRDPEDPTRTDYPLFIRGTLPDGSGTTPPWIYAVVPDDCQALPRTTNVEPFCFEGRPTVHVGFSPMGAVLESASSLGVPLSCIGMTPVDMYCGVLPGEANMPITVTTCFAGEDCETWSTNVPDCSGPANAVFSTVTPTCYDPLGPVLIINYAPATSPLVSASANGTGLTCYDAPEPGWYMCSGIPGAAGDALTVDFCLEDGTCFSQASHVSDCGVAHWGEDWQLIAVACTTDVTQISFMVDTSLDWLVPGAAFTYTARDGEINYSCSVHPTIAGRVYCAGPRPESPGNLEFCIQQDGAASPTCETFDTYPGWVAETTCEEPVTEEPVDPCSVHTDAVSCNKDKPACRWIYTDPQHCVSNP